MNGICQDMPLMHVLFTKWDSLLSSSYDPLCGNTAWQSLPTTAAGVSPPTHAFHHLLPISLCNLTWTYAQPNFTSSVTMLPTFSFLMWLPSSWSWDHKWDFHGWYPWDHGLSKLGDVREWKQISWMLPQETGHVTQGSAPTIGVDARGIGDVVNCELCEDVGFKGCCQNHQVSCIYCYCCSWWLGW
jgi:hypothetical protein